MLCVAIQPLEKLAGGQFDRDQLGIVHDGFRDITAGD
jgi:hypothetical protein